MGVVMSLMLMSAVCEQLTCQLKQVNLNFVFFFCISSYLSCQICLLADEFMQMILGIRQLIQYILDSEVASVQIN